MSHVTWGYNGLTRWVHAEIDEADMIRANFTPFDFAMLRENPMWGQVLRPLSTPVAELMSYALEQAIEPEAASALITGLGLSAPSTSVTHWPWTVQITTLGGLQWPGVESQTQTAGAGETKRPQLLKRSLQLQRTLLVNLIAAGRDGIAEKQLVEQLWSEDNFVKARRLLVRTLQSLRQRLGSPTAVRQVGRRLFLNPGCCWVDCWAFADLVDRDKARALALYAGRFLPGEPGEKIDAKRTQLHERYVQAVIGFGHEYENMQRHAAALALYRAALQIDLSCESFYQGVMRCELQLGRPTEARRAYDLLTLALSAQPGTRPSSVSEKIVVMIDEQDRTTPPPGPTHP